MIKDKQYILIVIVLVFCLGYFIFLNNDPCDLKSPLISKSDFLLTGNLSCFVKRSSDKKDIGEAISFININTDNPKVLFSGSGGTTPLKKLFEDEDTLTLGLVAYATGSTDMFILNKKTGEFARTYSNNLFSLQASAAKGMCK